ncbi:MAG: PAS domain-containing sensor histidine kinase, partial [Isosphaeraceae bacterium]
MWRYGGAVALAALALLLRRGLDPLLGDDYPFVTVIVAVSVVAWSAGRAPALVALVIGAAGGSYLFLAPRNSFAILRAADRAGLAMNALAGLAVVALFGSLRDARRRLDESRRQLEAEVAARREAQEALAGREELLRITLASIGDGVITTDEAGRVASLNAAACALTGWDDSAIGRPLEAIFRIVNESTRLTVQNPVAVALSEGRVVGLANHTVLIARDGTERSIDDSAAPIRDRAGRIVGGVLVFRDISDRRRAESERAGAHREAVAARDLLDAILTHTPVGVAFCGRDLRILRLNPAFAELDGRPVEAQVGHTLPEILPTPAEDLLADFRRVLEGGETVTNRLVTADVPGQPGLRRYWLVNLYPVPLDDGPGGVGVTTLEITGLRRAEEAAREREGWFRATFEQAAVGVAHVAPDGRWLRVNRKLCEILGSTEAELFGRTIQDITHPDDLEADLASARRLLAGEIDTYAMEKRYFRGDGSLVWTNLTVSLARTPDGAPDYFISVVEDISARRLAEEQFRTLADSIPQLCWMADPDGHILWLNRRCYEYTGLPFEGLAGWAWQALLDPAELPTVLREWHASIATGRPLDIVFSLRGQDGVLRPFLSRVEPLRDGRGQVIRWFGTNTDISEAKRAEDELRRAQAALEQADRRKDEFLATLAHELRNPLAPIRNALQILRVSSDPAAHEHARGLMQRQFEQMVRLVDDLLDLSRIGRGALELRREPVALAAVIESAVETSRPWIDDMGHELTVDLPDRSIVVDADLVRLAQVFSNLLNNSAKYMDRGGRIRVSAERQGGEVAVSVRDTGIGIDAQQLPRLFEMFSQVDSSLERSQGGLGIGLTLVKRLVERHGGRVEARSEGLGRGAEFV